MDNSQDYIIIQHRSDSPNSRSVNNSTAKDQEMLTPLINMTGHAASEQLTKVPTEASMPNICGSDPTFSVALPQLSIAGSNNRSRFSRQLQVEDASCNPIRHPFSGSPLAQGSPIRWLRQSAPNIKPLIATAVAQFTEKRSSDVSASKTFPDSAARSGLSSTGNSTDVTPNMAAPMIDQHTVASLHKALGLDTIVRSIKELSSLITDSKRRDEKHEEKDDDRPSKRMKLTNDDRDRDDVSDIEEKADEDSDLEDLDDSRFGSAFAKSKTSSNVNKPLADMMSKASTSTADSDFVKDIREKYNRPSNVPFLLVPTVNSSIYKKMSRFNRI